MYDDRVEITSPGGLPVGVSKEEYLHHNISLLRNPIIAGVFFRLALIEKFGTGIARIKDEYSGSLAKPDFLFTPNSIRVVLPVITGDALVLTADEMLIVDLLRENIELSRQELDRELESNKDRTLRVIGSLLAKNIVQRKGSGPGTTYILKH